MLTQLPGADEMYDAIVRRGASYEGVFFTAVTTTGIFCRPVCPARKPRREHVEFFASAGGALHAGYRPCKRCRPLKTAAAPLVQRLVSAVEAEPELKWTAAELAARGIDPDTARRQFRRRFGLTFAGTCARVARASRWRRCVAGTVSSMRRSTPASSPRAVFATPSSVCSARRRATRVPSPR